jgi:hypothetical protein
MRPPSKRGLKTRRKKTQKGGKPTRGKDTPQPLPGPCQCHPSVGDEVPPHGCLPIDVLKSVAVKLNINESLDGKELREAIETAVDLNRPNAERSFLEALPIPAAQKRELSKKYLRPAMPKSWEKDPDMWLDSNNISAVLNQYEEKYAENGKKGFEMMGPFPIDFAAPDPYNKSGAKKCLMNEICEIRVEKAIANGTRAIGIVYNLDPHFKSGSHWVANYIDIPGHTCYYFDSYGMEPPPQVATFMKWLTTQDPEMKLNYNARRLQYKNTECGVYCIYMIIRMLMGDKFTDITRRKPKDDDMERMRRCLFST